MRCIVLAIALTLAVSLSARAQDTGVLPPVANANANAAAIGLTDRDVDMAIAAGQRSGGGGGSYCMATSAFMDFSAANGSYNVLTVGPLGRIAYAAAEAKKKYLPYTRANVTPDLRQPAVSVFVEPNPPEFTGGTWHQSAPVKHVVLKLKGRADDAAVIQPISIQLVDRSWNNSFGATFTSQGAVANFDWSSFQQLPAGDVDVVVITDAGERRCKIGKKDRANLR